jgi:predicted Zn finger-like uncharacterized protein
MSETTDIQCQKCKAVYTVPRSALKEDGLFVKCSACGAAFTVFPPREAPMVPAAPETEEEDLFAIDDTALDEAGPADYAGAADDGGDDADAGDANDRGDYADSGDANDGGDYADSGDANDEVDYEPGRNEAVGRSNTAEIEAAMAESMQMLAALEGEAETQILDDNTPQPIATEPTPSNPRNLFQAEGDLLHEGTLGPSAPPPPARMEPRVTTSDVLPGAPVGDDDLFSEAAPRPRRKLWAVALVAAVAAVAAAGAFFLSPSGPPAELLAGDAAVVAGDLNTAGEQYAAALTARPESDDARAGMAWVEMRQADDLLTDAHYLDSADLLAKGEALAELARGRAKAVLDANPTHERAHRALARYYVTQGGDALPHLGALAAGDAEALVLSARAIPIARYDEALAALTSSTSQEAQRALLVLYDRAGKADLALALAGTVLEKNPGDPVATSLVNKYKVSEAPPSPSYSKLMQKAAKLRARKKFKPALALFDKAGGARPGHPDAIAGAAWCRLGMKQTAAALAAFEALVAKSPDYADAYLGIGDAQRTLGQKTAAAKAYGRYLELLPAGPGAKLARKWAAKLAK